MAYIKRLVLDILKPHHPDALEFAKALAELGADYRVTLTTVEMDEQTQTLRVVVRGRDLALDRIQEVITTMGASLHSIDEVEA
ncbi:MAG: DUF211 domain-containing protein, partial [Candidatus Competibacteraceae bacterium]|nr:DUF211 domain-containing protein [Candidatus Competibacteraceae bacterium]